MLDQVATFIVRAVSWLVLVGSIIFAAANVAAISAAANMTAQAGIPHAETVVGVAQVFAILPALFYIALGALFWAMLNVIASIADNLIAMRETNEQLLQVRKIEAFREPETTFALSRPPVAPTVPRAEPSVPPGRGWM